MQHISVRAPPWDHYDISGKVERSDLLAFGRGVGHQLGSAADNVDQRRLRPIERRGLSGHQTLRGGQGGDGGQLGPTRNADCQALENVGLCHWCRSAG